MNRQVFNYAPLWIRGCSLILAFCRRYLIVFIHHHLLVRGISIDSSLSITRDSEQLLGVSYPGTSCVMSTHYHPNTGSRCEPAYYGCQTKQIYLIYSITVIIVAPVI